MTLRSHWPAAWTGWSPVLCNVINHAILELKKKNGQTFQVHQRLIRYILANLGDFDLREILSLRFITLLWSSGEKKKRRIITHAELLSNRKWPWHIMTHFYSDMSNSGRYNDKPFFNQFLYFAMMQIGGHLYLLALPRCVAYYPATTWKTLLK